MKKKFNPSAALGYNRIKPLYDKAVSDLIIETKRADDNYDALVAVTVERDSLLGIKDKQRAKLKSAGHNIGQLIREIQRQDKEILALEAVNGTLTNQLMGDQRALGECNRKLDIERKRYGLLMAANVETNQMLRYSIDHVEVHKRDRQMAERERTAALADVRKAKASKRKWAIIAVALAGLLVAAAAKAIEIGVI